jgi:hypothetical protein
LDGDDRNELNINAPLKLKLFEGNLSIALVPNDAEKVIGMTFGHGLLILQKHG